MASCPKCGNHPLRKPKGKPRRCKRCGSSVGAVRTAQIALALSQQVSA